MKSTAGGEIEVDGFKTLIASREDLILPKLHWAKNSRSEMKLQDVHNLLATSCDWEYLRRWAAVLSVELLLEECRDA